MPHNRFSLLLVMLGHAIGHLLFLHYHLYFQRLKRAMAERQGFEPWIPCGIHAFQACAFSHSAISPQFCGLFESNTIRTSPRRRAPFPIFRELAHRRSVSRWRTTSTPLAPPVLDIVSA